METKDFTFRLGRQSVLPRTSGTRHAVGDRASSQPARDSRATTAVELDGPRHFFNYDLELEKAFKAIQRKVQAVGRSPRCRSCRRTIAGPGAQAAAACIVALMEEGWRSGKESA